jgi:hypothetical protein
MPWPRLCWNREASYHRGMPRNCSIIETNRVQLVLYGRAWTRAKPGAWLTWKYHELEEAVGGNAEPNGLAPASCVAAYQHACEVWT